MADVYASNQDAPLGQLLPACREAYGESRAGREPPVDEVSCHGAQRCDRNGLLPGQYRVAVGALVGIGDILHVQATPTSEVTGDGFVIGIKSSMPGKEASIS